MSCKLYGRLAQLVEHSLDVRNVSGSSPLTSTIILELKALKKESSFLILIKERCVWAENVLLK